MRSFFYWKSQNTVDNSVLCLHAHLNYQQNEYNKLVDIFRLDKKPESNLVMTKIRDNVDNKFIAVAILNIEVNISRNANKSSFRQNLSKYSTVYISSTSSVHNNFICIYFEENV